MQQDPVIAVVVGAAVAGSPNKRISTSSLKKTMVPNTNPTKVTGSKLPTTLSREESCLRQFEHFCRAPSASSGDRLLLDPAGEGEDILNEESTPPYNVGRRKGNNNNNNNTGKSYHTETIIRLVRSLSVDSAISSKSAPQLEKLR
jgi:hypothetical protein